MILKEMAVKDFRSFAESHRVIFQSGINVVYSPTGKGKSNLKRAIPFGLYGMEGVPGKSKAHILFAGSTNCFVELGFTHEGEHYRVGREVWRDPETNRFRMDLTLREASAVLGGRDAQKRINELMPKELFDLLTVDGRELAPAVWHLSERREVIESALGIPHLVRARDLAQSVQTFFNSRRREVLSAYQATKERGEVITQLLHLIRRMKGCMGGKVGIEMSKILNEILIGLGGLRSGSGLSKSAMGEIEGIEKRVKELQKMAENFEGEFQRENQGLERQQNENKREMESRSRNVDLWQRCGDLAGRTEAAFQHIIKLHEEEKRDGIDKSINEIFSAIASKPTFGGLKLTPNYEILVKEMGKEYAPDQTRPSSGEQDSIAISFLFGLGKVASGAECLILDDPTIHFDVAYKKGFTSKLPDLGFKQVIILTNDPDLKEIPEASQVIEVWMEEGRSKIKKTR